MSKCLSVCQFRPLNGTSTFESCGSNGIQSVNGNFNRAEQCNSISSMRFEANRQSWGSRAVIKQLIFVAFFASVDFTKFQFLRVPHVKLSNWIDNSSLHLFIGLWFLLTSLSNGERTKSMFIDTRQWDSQSQVLCYFVKRHFGSFPVDVKITDTTDKLFYEERKTMNEWPQYHLIPSFVCSSMCEEWETIEWNRDIVHAEVCTWLHLKVCIVQYVKELCTMYLRTYDHHLMPSS